jgi:uncharacterized protein HemX
VFFVCLSVVLLVDVVLVVEGVPQPWVRGWNSSEASEKRKSTYMCICGGRAGGGGGDAKYFERRERERREVEKRTEREREEK